MIGLNMLHLRYNPNSSQHFTTKIDAISGVHSTLNIPFRCKITQKSSEVQRYQRYYEDVYTNLLKKSVIIIQKHARRLLAKAKVRRRIAEILWEMENRNASIIQKVYHTYVALQLVKRLKNEKATRILRENSARKIQKLYRQNQLIHKAYFHSIIGRIFRIRRIGAIRIQKCARGYMVRRDVPFVKNLKLSKLIRWKYDADEVGIIGTFTNPPWKHKIPLVFSTYLKEYFSTFFLDNKLAPGRYYLKFVVGGQWLCDGNMPIAQDIEGNYNNLITVQNERKGLPKAGSSQSLAQSNPLGFKEATLSSPAPQKITRTLSGGLLDSSLTTAFLNQPENTEDLKLVFGSFMAAYPKQRHTPLSKEGTADAIFINQEMQAFGLSDGVGE